MTLYSGQKPTTPVYLQKATAYNDAFVFKNVNYSGDVVKFKVWQYAGASLDINDTMTVSYSSPDTTITAALVAADTNLAYSRGWYSIHNETDDEILMHGPLIVQEVPYS